MIKVYETPNKPIKSWATDLEDGAFEQALHLSALPFVYKHVALMPDAHQGYGMPIGGVIATEGVIIPNAVGVDIGCGMCALKTPLTYVDKNSLKNIMGKIRRLIPVGFNKHQYPVPGNRMPFLDSYDLDYKICRQEYINAQKSLGTLGGGNHFTEIQKDNDGYIWIMIHSGSRNLGKKVADYYNAMAKEENEMWYSVVNKKHDLAFLPIESEYARKYLKEMQYCVDFAFLNRQLMMENVIDAFNSEGFEITMSDMINVAHNYARLENHFGKNVWVHRKGATSARLGEIGIIPGSQGTKSYIVEGLGNKESFESCSHGAGRKMGRKQAERELNLEDEIAILDKQGIIHGIRNEQDLDEATSAYKDIDIVMENQKDLVKILVELKPLAVIKG